ncbi:MAG: hypothetical protein HY810_02730 [Candidatus Omnitrophica bacterium]|nr:hypothetical protein [Candidatus Omnitrophota bacterium]
MFSKFKIIIIMSFLLASCLCSISLADEVNTLVSIGADYWMPTLDAKIKSSELSVIGTQIDIIDDLGLDDSEGIVNIKGSIDMPLLPELYVSYFAIDGSGSKNITNTLTYKGQTYSATNNISSKYDVTQFEGLLIFHLINTDIFRVGPLVGAKYFEVETELKDNTTGIIKTESVDGPVPVIGISAAVKFAEKFKLECLARGLSIEIDNVDAAMFDVDLGLHCDFNRFLRVSTGYRYFAIDAEDSSNNDSVDIKFTGPYIGITGSF